MSDIAKCTGVRGDIYCPRREDCYRYKAESSIQQSFFMEAPFQLRYPPVGPIQALCVEFLPARASVTKGDVRP